MSITRTCCSGVLASVLLAAACTDDKPTPSDDLVLPGGGADGAGMVVHGALSFSGKGYGELSPATWAHQWSFELARPASLTLETLRIGTAPPPDTVLYLYAHTAGGRHAVSPPDDDGGDGLFSRLDVELGPGRYTAIVVGYERDEVGAFSIRGTCAGAGCEQAAACSPLDLVYGSNPCPDGQYCRVAELARPTDGTCRPARELFDAAVAEYVRRYGADPVLWGGSARGGLTGRVTGDFVDYLVGLDAGSRSVELHYQPDGSLYTARLGGLFRIIEHGRVLRPGEPTIFVSPPHGGTLSGFLEELAHAHLPHIPQPFQIEELDPTVMVLGTDELYEVEVRAALEARFPDHVFDYNGTHLVSTGPSITVPLATFD